MLGGGRARQEESDWLWAQAGDEILQAVDPLADAD